MGPAAAGRGAATIRAATKVKAAGSDLGAIEHVIFFMQENRSFDHYYGSYKGVRGFDDHPKGSLGAFAQAWPGGAAEQLLPFHLQADSGIGECTHDLNHTWPAEHLSRGAGNNADFVKTHTSAAFEGPPAGVLTMGYYTRADLPFYYALADAFTICDNYHCSVMGPTHPNRLMALSGTIDPAGRPGGRSSSPTRTPTPSGASTGPPCPRCSKTPASAGRSTTPRARSTPRRSSSSTGSWSAMPSSPTSASTRTRRRRCTRRPSSPSTRVTSSPTWPPASCPRSAGSSRRPATTSTLRRRRHSASGSPARC